MLRWDRRGQGDLKSTNGKLWILAGTTPRGLPDGSAGKESACNAGDTGDVGSIPGLGRSPGGGNGNPLQYSCLKNAMDRGAWWATACGIAESDTTEHADAGAQRF